MAWKGWLEFDPVIYAGNINVPLQIMHSQSAAAPQGAEKFYKNLDELKNIIWVDKGTQFDFYDQNPLLQIPQAKLLNGLINSSIKKLNS